jgi:hypothetical protein
MDRLTLAYVERTWALLLDAYSTAGDLSCVDRVLDIATGYLTPTTTTTTTTPPPPPPTPPPANIFNHHCFLFTIWAGTLASAGIIILVQEWVVTRIFTMNFIVLACNG